VEMAREFDGVEMDVDDLVSGRREMEEAARTVMSNVHADP
jgi:hypothetical protein